MDIELDPLTGDLELTNGITFVKGGKEARQRIELALGLNLGEFFTHLNYGLPYIRNRNLSFGQNLRYFLGDKFPDTAGFVKGELDRYILSLPIVSSLESDYSFDNNSREFKYSFSVVTTEGEEINFPPYLQQL